MVVELIVGALIAVVVVGIAVAVVLAYRNNQKKVEGIGKAAKDAVKNVTNAVKE